jgi:23S rRNA (cytosine1962-C5)-methyltransferase
MAENGRDLECGQVVDLLDHDGNWIARGVINPGSRLRVRLYGFDSSVPISADLWRTRIDDAIARRRLAETFQPDGAERLVFSESDLLSGLIVDRYADCLGVQFTSGGLLRWRDDILDHLCRATEARSVMVRIDEKTAKYETIDPEHDWFRGGGHAGPVAYKSNGLMLSVDLQRGQKTGGYLDQRINHAVAARYLSGRRVLDVCCYTGGFGLVAAKHGAASVVGVDTSQAALDEAQQAADRNELSGVSFLKEDCFDALKRLSHAGQHFDAIVLDPPRFAGSRHQIDAALRAYRRLNSLAVDLLPPGGVLVTCSCSGRVGRADFMSMLADVAKRRRRDLVVLENRGPSPDHPVSISCPETDYLKCIVMQVC